MEVIELTKFSMLLIGEIMLANGQGEQMYGIGFYTHNKGFRVWFRGLEPMTHRECMAFKSKQSNPDNWFVLPLVTRNTTNYPHDLIKD